MKGIRFLLDSVRGFVTTRKFVLCSAAMIAFVVHAGEKSAAARDRQATAEFLGAAAGGETTANEVIWEPSGGILSDLLFGRRVVFLVDPGSGKRDVYRGLVRLSPAGQAIAVRSVTNLTDTAQGDDAALVGDGRVVAFATIAMGSIQSVSVLELGGIREQDKPKGPFDRLLLALTSYQETHSLAGIGRTDIRLPLPIERASLSLKDGELFMGATGSDEKFRYQVAARTIKDEGGTPGYAPEPKPQVHRPKPALFWAVDTLRAEVGPEPVAWLENKVFAARDALKQTTYRLFSGSTAQDELKVEAARVPPKLDTTRLGEENWPPPPIPSFWKEPRPQEGEWRPVAHPFLRPLPGASPSKKPPHYFYQTFIRPDSQRPYSEVTFIAMDMRQLELRMQAGFEDPQPTTGPPGDGRIPTSPEEYTRVVGTFNGAFKTTHGEYGMMVDRRVLVPPVAGAATVITDEDGRTGLGSWPQNTSVPANVVSYRQNLDALVEDGKANPTGRYVWGWQLEGESVLTQRTALCVTEAGHLYYAFGEELDGPTLGRALVQAGCTYGVHLDMNPGHCGFVFTEISDLEKGHYKLALADDGMKISPDKFVRWSAKDFFYVQVRDARPIEDGGIDWQPATSVQPTPDWLPAVFTGTARAGSIEVELTAFAQGRFDFRMRAGRLEPTILGAPPMKLELSGDDVHRVVAAIGLGHATEATRYGMMFGRDRPVPLRESYATLVLRQGAPPMLFRPAKLPPLAAADEAVQLPLLAVDGRLTERGRRRGAMRQRGALCVTGRGPSGHGRLLVAQATHDSNDLIAGILLKRGCADVAELDRGSHHPPFMHRAGTDAPPVGAYDVTTLYALAGNMKTQAYRWLHEDAVPSTKPSGFDVSLEAWRAEQKRKADAGAQVSAP